jgi:HK97 family phage major capsid protein
MFITLKKAWQNQAPGATLEMGDNYAQALIKDDIADKVEGDPYGPLMAKAVQTSVDCLTKNLDGVITQALKQFADAQGRSKKNAVPLIFGPDGEGEPKKNFGDFLLGVARKDSKYLEQHYGSVFNEWQKKAALGDSSGATGGYAVPPDFYAKLVAIMEENTFFRKRAFVMPMASATLQIPYLDVTTAQSAGVSPFFGGLQMYWTAEAQTRTETEPAFKQLELKANELSGYSVSSNILLQDAAFGLEKFLFTLFGRALGWYEEYAFLQGNGVGKPQGVLSAGATIAVTRNAGSAIKFVDVAKMFGSLLPASQTKAIWITTPTCVQQLLQLVDAGNRALFLPSEAYPQTGMGGIHQAPNWTLLGLPLFITEKLPALGTKGDLMLADPSLYVIGDRMQVEVAASEHVNFLKNQMTWRVVERVDGQPWMDKPVTLQDSTTTVSPFVVLN